MRTCQLNRRIVLRHSPSVLGRTVLFSTSEQLEHSYAIASDWPIARGPGGSGQPSATSVAAFIARGPGGSGQPSAINVRSIVTGLPPERLTDRITGSIIKTAKTETATTMAIFFKGVSLLTNRVRRDSLRGVLCLKMFRMRNTGRHENTYTASAKPQSHSGLHTDDSCGYPRPICPADLPGFVAGSLQRPV